MLHDHLGSPNLIVDQNGQVLQNQSFDAFGQRRDNLTWLPLTGTALTAFDTSITKRGYTGHEGSDALGLIHMNGRVYEPKLGRFISADPTIDGVTTSQGFNRYSYVHNNPMNVADPSGFGWTRDLWRDVKPYVGAILAVVITYYCWACGPEVLAAWFAAAGAVNGYIQTGTLSGTVIGAFTGAVAGYFGGAYGWQAAVAANAIAGGIAEQLQGGSFGHGFVTAGLSTLAGVGTGTVIGPIDFNNVALAFAKIAARAVVGGTISEASGGKFANGAISAAFTAAAEGWVTFTPIQEA